MRHRRFPNRIKMISPLLYAYGPSCVLCVDPDLKPDAVSLLMRLSHAPSSSLPIRLGAPHKVFTQQWWQSHLPSHRLEAWKEWGFRELDKLSPQKTVEETYISATEAQKRALVLASEPLLLTHVNSIKQEDGSLKSPVAQTEVASPSSQFRIDTAVISKAPIQKKLVMAIKFHDLAGLDPKSCLKLSKDGQNCEHPTQLLTPLWQAAIEKVLTQYNQAELLKPLEQHRHKILFPHNQEHFYSAKMKKWVLGDARSLETCDNPTHIVNTKTNSFRNFTKKAVLNTNEVAIHAEPLPPMTAALGPHRVPASVWKTRQGSFLVESPEFKTEGDPVHSFEQLPISQNKAQSLMSLPPSAIPSARIQLQLLKKNTKTYGWIPTKPDSFWMIVSPQTGAFAPLPTMGVRLVTCKGSKKFKQFKSAAPIKGSKCVTGVDSDLYVIDNQNTAALDEIKTSDDVAVWEQIRQLCVHNTPQRCLGFVSV